MLTQSSPPTRVRPPSGRRRTINAVAATWRNRRASSSPRSSPSRTSSSNPAGSSSAGRSSGPILEPSGRRDRPAEVGDDQVQVAAEPPAQPRGGRSAQGLARRAAERGVEGVDQAVARRRRDIPRRGASSAPGDLADLLLAGEEGFEDARPRPARGRATRRARPGAPRGRRPGPRRPRPGTRRGPGPARPRAPGGRSTIGASSARRRTAFAWTISPSIRRNSNARPSRTKRSPACSRSAYAPSSVPIDSPSTWTRTDSSEVIVPTFDQNQRITRRLRMPNSPPLLPDPGRGPLRGRPRLGLVGPGGRGEVAGEEGEAGVEVGPGQVGHRRRPCGPGRRPRRLDHSPPQAMPISCWQRTSSGPSTIRERLDPAGLAPPAAVTTAPASSAGVAARIRPRVAAPTRCPARPTRWRHREAPPGQADQDRQVGRADVDAQLQARAGDDRLQLARLQRGLDLAPARRRRAPSGARRRPRGRRPASGGGRA